MQDEKRILAKVILCWTGVIRPIVTASIVTMIKYLKHGNSQSIALIIETETLCIHKTYFHHSYVLGPYLQQANFDLSYDDRHDKVP